MNTVDTIRMTQVGACVDMDSKLNGLLTRLASLAAFPCQQQKDGKACLQQYDHKFNSDGSTKLYFSTGCKVVEAFCDACSAYWHVAVARNAINSLARTLRMP